MFDYAAEAESFGKGVSLNSDSSENTVPVMLHHFFELLRLTKLIYGHPAYLSILFWRELIFTSS